MQVALTAIQAADATPVAAVEVAGLAIRAGVDLVAITLLTVGLYARRHNGRWTSFSRRKTGNTAAGAMSRARGPIPRLPGGSSWRSRAASWRA